MILLGRNQIAPKDQMTTATQVPIVDQPVEQGSLLLIDTNALFREGLRGLLAASHFNLAHVASDLPEALEIVRSGASIGLVIFDFDESMSDQELQILRQIKNTSRGTKLVVLTNNVSINLLAYALSCGVDGYLLKSLSSSALLKALRLIELGEKVMPTRQATMLTDGQLDPSDAEARVSSVRGLSDREREILSCLNEGHANKVIARRLDITEATVKVHLKAVMRKLNVATRTEAAIWPVRQGDRRDAAGK